MSRCAAARAPRGATLPELLVVLALLGLLGVVAQGLLQPALQRARRGAAGAALLELALRQERHLARHGRYAVDPRALGLAPAPDGSVAWPSPARPWYALRLHGAASNAPGLRGYRAVATPQGLQSGDACGSLSIDQAGRRQAACDGGW